MLLPAAMLAASASGPIYRHNPSAGLRSYRYQATETVLGGPARGYRTDFDLEYSGGAICALVRKSSVLDGIWKPVEPDPSCRAAMHGGKTILARVKLSPLSPDAGKTLGASFLPMCAPPGIFFPLTDILNVVIVPSPHFRATELRKVGQSLSYKSFDAAFDRSGIALKETSPGGEIELAAIDARRAVIEWKPALAELELVEHSRTSAVTLRGTEQFAFRVEINRHTGAIERARTINDDLDLKIVGAADTNPHVRITRTVTIDPL